MGFSDDRRFLWAGGLDDSKIYVFDIGTDPGNPRLVKTIGDLPEQTGFVGPHTFYALPGRVLVGNLSNSKDHGGVTGMALYNNRGDLIQSYPMPTTNGGDGYGYDIAINPQKNVLLTSSFAGWNNYMRNLGELVGDAEAMKHFGNTVVLWDLKTMSPKKVFSVPGAPLEIRWSLKPGDNWAVVATALTSKIWLIKQDASGEWQAKDVAVIGDPSKIPLPVDISITADGKGLWVNTFMDGKTRYFDLSNPEHPTQTYEKATGKQVNMVSQSWDGKRVYITSSLLANWDKTGENDVQFLRGFDWDGKRADSDLRSRLLQREAGSGTPYQAGFESAEGGLCRSTRTTGVALTAAGARAWLLPAALALLIGTGGALAHEVSSARADFVPPEPGTYKLERIQALPDGPSWTRAIDARVWPSTRKVASRC